MKKTFTSRELLDLGLPYCDLEGDGAQVVEREMKDRTRWSVVYRLVFRLPGQPEGEAWLTSYSSGATEYQSEGPWEYQDEVEAELVRRVQKVVDVWEPADSSTRAVEKTSRGFGVYGEIPSRPGTLRVQESSLAFQGAHVWLFLDGAPPDAAPQLSVEGAKLLVAALSNFIRDAEGELLTEPASYPTE